MKPNAGWRSAPFLVALTVGASAQVPMPAVRTIDIPGGTTIQIASPPATCSYPSEVRDRLATFLSGGGHGLRLLDAAGDCGDMERLTRGSTGLIRHSFQIAMLKDEEDPQRRPSKAAHLRRCVAEYPKAGETGSDAIRHALKEVDGQLETSGERSLGLLASSRDAVFGGALIQASRAPRRVLLVQVTACLSLRDVPLVWMFQEAIEKAADEGEVARTLRDLSTLAQSQTKAAIELARDTVRRP